MGPFSLVEGKPGLASHSRNARSGRSIVGCLGTGGVWGLAESVGKATQVAPNVPESGM